MPLNLNPYPIGSYVESPTYGLSLVLGHFSSEFSDQPTQQTMIWSFNKNEFTIRPTKTLMKRQNPTSNDITFAQNKLLSILKTTPIQSQMTQTGTTIQIPADGLEYIILDNGHTYKDTQYFFAVVYRAYDNRYIIQHIRYDDWLLEPRYSKYHIINTPTTATIQKAKNLLFEYIIAPAFVQS